MNEELIKAVEELEEQKVLKLAHEELDTGVDHSYIQEQLKIGMEKVGKLYENGEYFIADLIMAGIIFKNVLKLILVSPKENNNPQKFVGKVLLGTAEGDLHDIGKDIFVSMITAAGFEVRDLGVDVSPMTFIENVKDYQPQVVGISGVITLSLDSMQKTVQELEKAGLRKKVKIILGGTVVKSGVDYIGADAFTNDPALGVKICLDWIKNHKQGN